MRSTRLVSLTLVTVLAAACSRGMSPEKAGYAASSHAALLPSPMAPPPAEPAPEKAKLDAIRDAKERGNTEAYSRLVDNAFLSPARAPLSTFSIDVDTASYSNVRRFLTNGTMPPPDAVRIEELVNYFGYAYPEPAGDAPFSISTEVADAPWAKDHRLVRIGLQGKRIAQAEMPPRNLVFLVDVSGSMSASNKLPLLQQALRDLVETLTAKDRVSLVAYAGSSGVVLEPTPATRKDAILDAIDRLSAGGSTNGAGGITEAYALAERTLDEGGINRVILATDGDFNVGVTSEGDLVRLIEREREKGVFLTVLGFGMGNYKDSTLEKLADHGNGNYAYIDTHAEARKVLVEQGGSTLVTIAKDVKIQVEMNPAKVGAYRLIGYENRLLAAEDFNDDRKDAGEIGAGHSVTALYEIVPLGVPVDKGSVDPLKYQTPAKPKAGGAVSEELMTVKLRFKRPTGDTSELLSSVVRDARRDAGEASDDFRFASAVAGFGMLLRQSPHRGAATPAMVRGLASGALGKDPHGHRQGFVTLLGSFEKASGQGVLTTR